MKARTPEEHALYRTVQESQSNKKYVMRCIIGVGTATLLLVPEDSGKSND